MKTYILTAFLLSVFFTGFAQQNGKIVSPHAKNAILNCSTKTVLDNNTAVSPWKISPIVKSALSSAETTIGNTWFDFQTNGSIPQRIYEYNDGNIGACWAYGVANPLYADRGTGYNYYNANNWGNIPTARVEDVKTGTPSYAPWGTSGEILVSHTNSNSGLKIAKRTSKGSGTWTLMTKQGPSNHQNVLWPRVETNGANNQNIHIIALTAPLANGGSLYNGQNGALLYSRSSDGGATWNIDNMVLPGTDTANYPVLNGDCYAFANPVGNTLALVYGNVWTDIFLLKSTDNGDTWTKTIIFQHPYPKFKESTTLVTDTPYVCDNSLAVALDNTGKAYVFFGIQRALNDIVNDSSFSLMQFTDGLAFWKEGQPAFTSLNPDIVNAGGNLVGWTQDVNGNDTILEFISSPAIYKCSVTSMPTVTIDQGNNRIYLFFTSIVEGMTNSFQNYRHVYSRRSDDGGTSWTAFNDITGDAAHNGYECVFPSVSPTSDEFFCHLIYQKDQQPGMSYDGDMDPAANNDIVYLKFPKLTTGINPASVDFVNVSCYPNPFHGSCQINLMLINNTRLSIEVSDFLGRIIYQLPSASYSAGSHQFVVDASSWYPGIYFYTLKGVNQSLSGRMIVQ